MGLPALRHDAPHSERPKLTLVHARGDDGRQRAVAPRKTSRSTSKTHRLFRTFVVGCLLFSGLGIARVALAARATSISIESGALRTKLKEARFEGDSLEIRISQLASPSRIRSVAGAKMKMAPAAGTSYVTIDGSSKVDVPTEPKPAQPATATSSATSVPAERGLLASVMHAAAGEAQILLLGDVGLASSR